LKQADHQEPKDKKLFGLSDQPPASRIFDIIPFLLAGLSFLLMLYSAVYGEPFNVSREDGLLEWGSVFFFVICAMLSIFALVCNSSDLEKRQKIFLVLFSLILIAAAGEEISWGQRILHWYEADPADEKALIHLGHGDLSLHNVRLESKYVRFSIGSLLFGVVLLAGLLIHGIWLPVAAGRGNPRALKLIEKTGVFVPPLRLGILVFITALIYHYLKRVVDLTQTREYKEFIIPMVYACMMVHCYFIQKKRWADLVIGIFIVLTSLWTAGTLYLLIR
jgi:hypothetical protein